VLYWTYCATKKVETTEKGSSNTSVTSNSEVENQKRKCLSWLMDIDDSISKEAIITDSPPLPRSTMPTLSYGLNITKKDPSLGNRSSATKRQTIFDDDDDSEPENNPDNAAGAEEINVIGDPTPSTPPSKPNQANTTNPSHTTHHPTNPKPPISQHSDLSTTHTSRQHASMATAIDASIYDYDSIYDTLHAPAQSRTSAAADAARKPKYMGALLAAAEVRKRDQLRAKDKMLLREREAEGEEFADKDKFVTGAYKAQQEEVKQLEEEESRREEEEARRGKGLGMVGFYKGVLERGERRFEEVVKAAAEGGKGGDGSGSAEVVEEERAERETSEAQVARDLNALGKGVVVNDDGQVVDKRQLLSAGLNVAPKPKSTAAAKASGSSMARPGTEMQFQGRGGSKQAMRERQTRMLEAQLEQVTKRAADDEEEQKEELERAAKSRKTEGDISGARERYLQRKKEAASAKAP